jgi:hypothetical protein
LGGIDRAAKKLGLNGLSATTVQIGDRPDVGSTAGSDLPKGCLLLHTPGQKSGGLSWS